MKEYVYGFNHSNELCPRARFFNVGHRLPLTTLALVWEGQTPLLQNADWLHTTLCSYTEAVQQWPMTMCGEVIRSPVAGQSGRIPVPCWGTFRNIRNQDYSFHGTFVPWTVRSLDHSFPRPNLTWNIPSLDYDRSNTKLIVYVKWWS